VYTLFYNPGTASMAVHLALLEIGVPYRLEKVEFPVDLQRNPEYARLNPRGQVPTLVIDGQPYYESAALVMLLAERHPEAKLAPPAGHPSRPAYLQWIAFLATSLGAPFRLFFYPRDLGFGDELPPAVRDAIIAKLEQAFDLVDAQVASSGPWLLGTDFSMADVLALMYLRWARNLPRQATTWPALNLYADRLRARPSWKKLYAAEGLTDWAA
jgi:glutathione S-transferase